MCVLSRSTLPEHCNIPLGVLPEQAILAAEKIVREIAQMEESSTSLLILSRGSQQGIAEGRRGVRLGEGLTPRTRLNHRQRSCLSDLLM
jgi:hypothetical protein